MYKVKCENDVGVKWNINFVYKEDAKKYADYQISHGIKVIIVEVN